MHSSLLDEREHYLGEAQWRSSQTFRHRQDTRVAQSFLLLAKDAKGCIAVRD